MAGLGSHLGARALRGAVGVLVRFPRHPGLPGVVDGDAGVVVALRGGALGGDEPSTLEAWSRAGRFAR